jgi:hypothetical protein
LPELNVAYDFTDDTLNLDTGSVDKATIMIRPEFRVPMDGLSFSDIGSAQSQLKIAPFGFPGRKVGRGD